MVIFTCSKSKMMWRVLIKLKWCNWYLWKNKNPKLTFLFTCTSIPHRDSTCQNKNRGSGKLPSVPWTFIIIFWTFIIILKIIFKNTNVFHQILWHAFHKINLYNNMLSLAHHLLTISKLKTQKLPHISLILFSYFFNLKKILKKHDFKNRLSSEKAQMCNFFSRGGFFYLLRTKY